MKTNLSLKDELLSAIRRIVAKFWAQEVGQLMRLQSVCYHADFGAKIGIRSRIASRMLLSTLLLLLTFGVGSAWGTDVTYTVTSTSAVSTSGTAPGGSSASYSQTYGTASQMTSGKSVTLTLTSLGGINISNITLSMKSNKSSGAGILKYSTDGGSKWTYLVGSSGSGVNFNNSSWYGSWSQSYVNVSKSVSLSAVTQLIITIEATANSLYCESFKLTYTTSGPTITTSVTSLSDVGYSTVDFTQQVKSFTVSGSSLTANVTVTAPTGFEVCNTSGGTYTSSVTFDKGSGTLAASTVYVRLQSGKSAGSYAGNVTCTSTGATSKTVALSGSVPFTVTWQANGSLHATTYVAYATSPGTALGTLPDDPDPSDYTCSTKSFYGWYDGNSYTNASVAPSTISTSTKITSDKTYNAVFADAEGESGTLSIDFESATSAFTDWTFNNFTSNQSGSIPAHGGSKYGTTGGNESGYVKTNNKIASPTSLSVFVSKQSTNTKSSTWYIKVSSDGSTWSTVTSKSATSMSAGDWEEMTADLSSYSNVYVELYYSGSTAVRNMDDLVLEYGNTTYSNYATSCGACTASAAIGTASLNGPFNLSTVGVQCASITPGTNCSVASGDYGFIWYAGTGNKKLNETGVTTVAVTSGAYSSGTFSKDLTSTFSLGSTYTFRAFAINGKPDTVYSAAVSFTPRSVTFNLNSHGSSAPSTQYVNNGGKATDPSYSESVSGWRFDGWYGNASCTGNAWSFADSIVSGANRTLYAKWTRVYSVTYAYAGGTSSCSDNTKYAAGATVTVCATEPTKAGSTFLGWLGDNSVGTKAAGATFSMPAANVTLTAQWEDTEYTLTQTKSAHTTSSVSATKIKSGDLVSTGKDFVYTISNIAANAGYALPKTPTLSGGGQTWERGTNYTWTLSDDRHSATLHIAADLTISANLTINVSEVTRYLVEWDEHGSIDSVYYASDDNSVTMKTGIDDCGTKKFYCWTEDDEFESHATTPPTAASSGSISGGKHYYAIYADAAVPLSPGYNKVTTISAGTYIIASASYAYKAVTSHVSASPSAGVISSLPTGATEVLVELGTSSDAGYFAISYDNSGTKTYIKGANKDLGTQTSAIYDWSLDTDSKEGEIKSRNQSGFYLQQNTANGDFKAYAHTQTVAYMYKKQTTTYSNFAKTCTTNDISITTPSGGTVSTSPTAGEDAAGAGQTITVTATPNSCKYLSALSYNDGEDDHDILSTRSFTMPAHDVTVTATFSDKTVSSIAPYTSTHRTLMQGTSFEGEQIRVTFNSGETEDLAYGDSKLAYTGYNMSTLGSQTVTVTYTGCGTTTTTYSITITDGIPVTFSDCGNTTLRKYDPGDVVPVETIDGEYPCVGWQFVGWSSSSVADNSTSFTPVTNFTASEARTLYAVYADTTDVWLSALDATEMRSGATYVIIGEYGGNEKNYALTTLDTLTNYLRRHYLSTPCEKVREPGTYKDRFKMKVNVPPSLKWFIYKDGDYWKIKNKGNNKYLKITTTALSMTNTAEDEFTFGDNDNDESKVSIQSHNSNYYLSYYNSGKYWNAHTSGYSYFCTNMRSFTSNPPCAKRSVTFHGNGGTVTAYGSGSSGGTLVVTEATRDAGIKLPTAAFSDCSGKSWTFMGWVSEERALSRVPILTTELLEDGVANADHTILSDDEVYYAVYSSTGTPETKYGVAEFVQSDSPNTYGDGTINKTIGGNNYAFPYTQLGHASSMGIQFKESTGMLKNSTSLGKINYISFKGIRAGSISNLHVYVGATEDAVTTELTGAGVYKVAGDSMTFYPNDNYPYFKITATAYTAVEHINVGFGLGAKIYGTTPDCSTISLSGDVYVTSRSGIGIMAVTPLSVEAHQLTANADVVITSNSSDVYFSTDRTPNFSKASKPTASVTVRANVSGELSATPIYVHYKPSSTGTGAASDVMVYANLSTPDPNIKGEHTIHVRNLPEKVVIAAKVGGAYYALPADMDAATNPEGVLIAVNEVNMTATAPENCSYTIWPVKTTNGEYDRYASNTVHYDGNAFGDRVRFSAVNNSNKGLWANNSNSENTIRNYAAITSASDGGTTENTNPAYEWIITTTIADGKWQYTLQTAQTQNDRNLRYWTAASGGPKWGTYASGEQILYLLPVTEITPFDAKVTEWGKNSAVFDVYPKVDETLANKVIAYIGASNSGAKDVTETTTSVKGTSSKYNYTINFGNDIDFSANEGATLRLDWKNNETLLGYSVIVIPTIIAEDANLHDIDEYKTHWESKDVHVLPGNTLTIDAGSFENHGVTIGTLEIYPGATVKVTKGSAESGTLTATNLILRNGWTRAGSKSYDVARLYIPSEGTLNATNVYSDWYIDFDQYYPIAVPWNVTLANMSYLNSTNAASAGVKLRYYDGESRASNVQSGVGESANWKEYGATGNLSTPATLTPGVGYAMTARRPTGKAFSIIRMPLTIPSASWTTNGEQGSVTVDDVTTHKDQVSVTAHTNTTSNTPEYAKGWNLIANPFMSLYNGTLSYGGNNAIEYANIPDINFQEYSQVPISSTTKLKPSSAFLVQASITGTATFATDSRVAAAPSYRNAGTATTPTQKAYILLADEQTEDMMGILVSEKYTADYELNADLEKLLSDGNTLRTYMRYNDMNMAYLAINEELAKQLIPVSVRIPADGEYTFRIHEASIADELEGIYLTDYQTNTVTNLLYDSYTFNAVAGTDNVRFAINAVIGKREVPTGVDISDSNKDRPTKFIWNDKVYILHNNVIYDSTGKRVNVINK